MKLNQGLSTDSTKQQQQQQQQGETTFKLSKRSFEAIIHSCGDDPATRWSYARQFLLDYAVELREGAGAGKHCFTSHYFIVISFVLSPRSHSFHLFLPCLYLIFNLLLLLS
jgi:hypothetical protein